MNIDNQFGRSVRSLRIAQNVSQRKFATMLSESGMTVDASAVSRIESGERSVRLNEAVKIASVLNCAISDLIAEDETGAMSIAGASITAAIMELERLRSAFA